MLQRLKDSLGNRQTSRPLSAHPAAAAEVSPDGSLQPPQHGAKAHRPMPGLRPLLLVARPATARVGPPGSSPRQSSAESFSPQTDRSQDHDAYGHLELRPLILPGLIAARSAQPTGHLATSAAVAAPKGLDARFLSGARAPEPKELPQSLGVKTCGATAAAPSPSFCEPKPCDPAAKLDVSLPSASQR